MNAKQHKNDKINAYQKSQFKFICSNYYYFFLSFSFSPSSFRISFTAFVEVSNNNRKINENEKRKKEETKYLEQNGAQMNTRGRIRAREKERDFK